MGSEPHSSSGSHDESAAPELEIELQPCIAEFMRTLYLPPSIVLLVVNITKRPVRVDNGKLEAFCLLVVDGELSIQAVLVPELHRFVITGELTEGSYIMLDRYKLEKARRVNEKGFVVYLAIANCRTVGHCPDFAERYLETKPEAVEPQPGNIEEPLKKKKRSRVHFAAEIENVLGEDPADRVARDGKTAPSAGDSDELNPSVPYKSPISSFSKKNPPKDILPPLSLAQLAALPIIHGQLCSVFAVIESVSPTTVLRTPGLKRDVYLVDASTPKRVKLSVWTDAKDFMPAPGTVALFRNVRNHRWDGCSLNAWPKDCGGWEWFVPDPESIDGCDVGRIRRWWDEKTAEERTADEKAANS